MKGYYIKNLMRILAFVIVLLVISVFNRLYFNNSTSFYYSLYKNELFKKVIDNETDDVDYNFLDKDLREVTDLLNEQISLSEDRKKKAQIYKEAYNVYSHKINEYLRILNDKLDDEDFHRLELDIDEYQKNIDYAISDLKTDINSSLEYEFYKNKYMFEEGQKKCRDILEQYKGFYN